MSFADVAFFYQVEGDPEPSEASGFITNVETSGYELQVGETYTGSGTGAIMTAGKISPAEVTASMVYTEVAADPSDKLWEARKNKQKVKFIWYPKGNAADNWKWETSYGYITAMTPPSGEMGSADAILVKCTLKCGAIEKTIVPLA